MSGFLSGLRSSAAVSMRNLRRRRTNNALERHALLAVCLGDLVRRRGGRHVEPGVERRAATLGGLELGDEVEYLMILLAAARSEVWMIVSNGFFRSAGLEDIPFPNCIYDDRAGQSDE